jgi:[ribosomal protein S5]-alanine N-acetyltransferase
MPDSAAPVVCTEALFLRHRRLDDTAPIFRLSREQGMRAWLPDQVYADEAEAVRVLRFMISQYCPSADPSNTPYVLAVCLAASGEVIGHVGFSPCEYGVEVGYAIGNAHQNRGYAKQAVLAASIWALSRYSLPFVHAVVAADSVGSCKVLESCGFQMLSEIERKLHGIERTVRIHELSDVTRREA